MFFFFVLFCGTVDYALNDWANARAPLNVRPSCTISSRESVGASERNEWNVSTPFTFMDAGTLTTL
jgi:hypothetical protein